MPSKKTNICVALSILLIAGLAGAYAMYNKQTPTKAEVQTTAQNGQIVQKAEGNTSSKSVDTSPADPNKVLSSGITLRDASISIKIKTDFWKNQGLTGAELTAKMSEIATFYGTSLDEISRMKESPATTSKPASSGTTAKSSGTNTSSGSTSSSSSVSAGGYEVTATDKNGNGIEDELEPYTITGGTSSIDQGIQIHSAGE